MIRRNPFQPARRGAAAGGNLGQPAQNYNNLGGYDTAALAAALQACGINCAPGQGPTPQQIAVLAQQAQAAQPQRCRRTMMGLAKFAVAASAQGVSGATNPVQYPFRGLRLMVPTDISPAGDLANLLVGTEPQIVQSQAVSPAVTPGIPLRAFDQTAQDSGFIDMDWCPPTGSTSITVTVNNKFAAPFPMFEGALEGLQLL